MPNYLYVRSIVVCLLCITSFFSCLSQDELKNINTGLVKYSKVSFDGTRLVSIANYYGSFRPYISTYNADSSFWEKPVQIFESSDIEGMEIKYPQLSFDNSKLYFSAKLSDTTDFDIYVSELKEGKWSKPMAVDIGINSSADETAASFSADEKKVLFTRPLPEEEKADEFCGQLFYSELTESGSWSESELLPPAYNTGCICSPYYTRDNKTFFYSSYEDVLDSEGKG